MKCFSVKGAKNTPNVKLCVSQGLIEISGHSAPINSHEFFQPIKEWVEEYVKAPKSQTNVNINFNFFDTGSSRWFINILQILHNIYKVNNQDVTISWFYDKDDDDMLEAGYDFEAIVKIPFKMIEVHRVNQ